MEYMTDAHIANVSEVLSGSGFDCETVHERMLGNTDSRVSIPDPKIVEFLSQRRAAGEEIVLICNDKDLAGHCVVQKLPVIFVPDLVLERVRELEGESKKKME